MQTVVFHIIGANAWAGAQHAGEYMPEGFHEEGFIHLSKRQQILRPANLLFKGRSDLVLLEIDVEALTAELRYEPGSHGEDEMFPHLYGPLNLNAVREVHIFNCGADGTFTLPASVAQAR